MSKKSWNFFSHLSEIKRVLNETVFRSRRPSSRIDFFKAVSDRFLRPFDNGTADVRLLGGSTARMRCAFCDVPCQYSTYYQLQPGELHGWKCDRHAHTVQYIAIPSTTHYAFYFTCWHRDKEYSIEAYKLPQGEQWELRCGSSMIIHLDRIPMNLTPDNIDRRIHTLLVFS